MVASFTLEAVCSGPADAPILRSLSVEVPCKGVTVLAGPSGAGKSSLLRLLNRLDDPTGGTIAWGGRELRSFDPIELRREVGMVFQRAPVFPGTTLENLQVAAADLTHDEAAEALCRAGLAADLADRAAGDLSGGEAQRMCFARALVTEPAVLLADEPTASLDGAARRTIETLARSLADDGMPLIWVSHDVDQLRRLADHVIVMVAGEVAAAGSLAELDAHPDLLVRELVGAR